MIRVPADYPTIQAAIDAAGDGDIIELASGRYEGTVDFRGKSLTLQSAKGQWAILDNRKVGGPNFVNPGGVVNINSLSVFGPDKGMERKP